MWKEIVLGSNLSATQISLKKQLILQVVMQTDRIVLWSCQNRETRFSEIDTVCILNLIPVLHLFKIQNIFGSSPDPTLSDVTV